LLSGLVAGSGLAALGSSQVSKAEEELRFPGDPAEHKLVYQFNKGDEETQKAILFSVGAMLRQWGDNVSIVVVAIGPGIHILAKNPLRTVPEEMRERISSLSEYGVKFHACGNTMKALRWEKQDMLPFADVVEVGASDLMELQEEGYAYISW
jgi:intracellular sulfur oxidation DsrE/DsrF family protein